MTEVDGVCVPCVAPCDTCALGDPEHCETCYTPREIEGTECVCPYGKYEINEINCDDCAW